MATQFCKECNYTGWVLDRRTNTAKRCKCTKQGYSDRKLESASIPKRYLNCTLQNFETLENKKYSKAVSTSQKLVDRFPKVKRGLLFMGPSGVGKTHLAISILKTLITEKGASGLFIDFHELIKRITSSYTTDTGETEYQLLEPVLNSDLLVLDDIGSKKTSEFVRDTLSYIINERYNNQRLTIVTTNFLDEDLPGFNEINYSLSDRIGVRIRSRLYEMCERVYMDGEDFRSRYYK